MSIIKGRLIFIDHMILEFMELISPDNPTYRFHYMDSNQHLIKRWDSAPHHPQVSTFPYHIHTANEISASPAVTLEKILDEIFSVIIDDLSDQNIN